MAASNARGDAALIQIDDGDMGEAAFVSRRFERGVRGVTEHADHFGARADWYPRQKPACSAIDHGQISGGLIGSKQKLAVMGDGDTARALGSHVDLADAR